MRGAPAMGAGHKKVFVGGLSWETDEDSLRAYFARFGAVSDCVIMRDRHTGHPRGFGFVTYDDEAVADRVAAARHELDGRQVEAKRAVPRSECAPAARVHARATKKVFVGGLPATCGTAQFADYFARFGDVADAQVMYDHNTGNSRGFGFVTFASEAVVDRVVEHDPHDIMGKFVDVKRAEPRQVLDARRRDPAAAQQPHAPVPQNAPSAQPPRQGAFASQPASTPPYGSFAPSPYSRSAPWPPISTQATREPAAVESAAGMGFFAPGAFYSPELAQRVHANLYSAAVPADRYASMFARPVSSARIDRRFHPYASRERVERSYR